MIPHCSWHAVAVTLVHCPTCKSLGLSLPPLSKLCLLNSYFFLTLNWKLSEQIGNGKLELFFFLIGKEGIFNFDGVEVSKRSFLYNERDGDMRKEMWCKTKGKTNSSLEGTPGFLISKPLITLAAELLCLWT